MTDGRTDTWLRNVINLKKNHQIVFYLTEGAFMYYVSIFSINLVLPLRQHCQQRLRLPPTTHPPLICWGNTSIHPWLREKYYVSMFSIISLRQQCQHRLKSPKNDDDLKKEDNPKSEDNTMKMNDIGECSSIIQARLGGWGVWPEMLILLMWLGGVGVRGKMLM